MQSILPGPIFKDAARRFVHNSHFVLQNHIMHIAAKEIAGSQGLLNVLSPRPNQLQHWNRHVGGMTPRYTGFGQNNSTGGQSRAGILRAVSVARGKSFGGQMSIGVRSAFIGPEAQHQRRAGVVNQHTVRFVDHRMHQPALHCQSLGQ